MTEENKVEAPQATWGTVENVIEFLKSYATWGLLQSIISWLIILVIIMTMTGTPISSITDRWFWLQETEMNQSYDLQLKTLDLLENDIMWKLDDIYDRMDSVEDDIDDLQSRVKDLEDNH